MKSVRIGSRRLYDSMGCSIANQQTFNLVFPFGDHLQAEIYMGNKPKFGIFTKTGHEDFAFPSTEIDFGHTTYHGDATQSPHPRTFFTEIVCSQAEIVTDELFDMFYRKDRNASHELLSRAEKHAEEYHVVAELLSGIIGLHFHSQFVNKLLNEGFVAFHDKIQAVNNLGSLIEVLKSVKINQPSVDTISQIFPAIGQLKVKEAERDNRVLGWLIRAWAERDIIAKFNALFIPLEMILDGVSGALSADLSSHIQALQEFIQAQGGEETERLHKSLIEVVSKIRPSLIDRFNTFADQAKMPGWENDKTAFKMFNRIRNGLLHRGDPNVRMHVPVGEEVQALEDLTERYVNFYLFRDTNGQSALLLGMWYAYSKRRMTMPQQPAVTLTDEERTTLECFVHRGKANARTLTRARILLKSADGWSTATLAATFDVCQATVTNVRGRFAKGGLEAVLHDKVQQHRRSALSGLQTAHLIAVACSTAPDGHDHWTVRLLAQKAVELGFVKSISPDTIHELLKKTNSSPGSMNIGACHQSEASL